MGLEIESIRYAHGAGHTDVCYGFNDGQEYILTCGSDGFVRIWDGLEDDDSTSDFVADQALSVACTGDQYLVATSNNYVQGYTFQDRKRDKIIFRFSAPVTHVITSSTNKYIAACSCDMEIQVLNTQTNKITTLVGHTAPVLSLSFDPMEEYLASSSCDGTVKIWDLSSGSAIKFFPDVIPKKNDFFKSVVLGCCAWKSKSGLLFVVPKGSQVIVYKRNSWEELYKLSSVNIEKDLSAVMFSPCGNYLAAASSSGEICIWETKYKSEVCFYRDPKKVGISGMVWQSDGNKIVFCDKLGRLGVLGGISEEIIKHSVHSEKNEEISTKVDDVPDSKSLFVYDDDDDDENCISLDKIKSKFNHNERDETNGSYIKNGDDKNEAHDNSEDDSEADGSENRCPKSPVSSEFDVYDKENAMLTCQLQLPFQPTSTPRHFEPRCLCFNEIGIIRYYNSDKTIDIQFHDSTFHHSLFLRSFGLCTMASLSSKVICLAVPSVEEYLSKMTCICLSSWAGKKEWTVHMPEKEDILAVATSNDWVAAATSFNNLRIFSHAGTQKQIIALPGRVVCMAGHGSKIFVVCHGGLGSLGHQNLIFAIYEIFGYYLRTLVSFQSLPMSPKSTIKWLGFTDEGTAATYDSDGIIRLLSQDSHYWIVICDMKIQKKFPSDNYFTVGLSETLQSVRCIFCRNSQYPLFINNPTVLEVPFKMPMCNLEDAKSTAEETFWRLMFSICNVQKMSSDSNELFNNFELPMTQAILKLFGDATNNAEDLRAVDLAHLMKKKPLDIAIKYANNQGRTYLVEKLKVLKPIDWMIQQPVSGNFSDISTFKSEEIKLYGVESNANLINSQQDLFEESSTSIEKEKESVYANESASTMVETGNKVLGNPFKKSNPQPNDGNKGLKYFDSLEKDSVKPFNVSKPLKLKLPSKKEANSEAKPKKPTFVEWFGKRKASLAKEYPNLSSSELTKLGTTLYKEETTRGNGEKQIVHVIDSETVSEDSSKRSSSNVKESSPKRFKSLEQSF